MLNVSSKSVKPLSSLRWIIAGLLLLASVLNYIDRQTLSILAGTIQQELGLDNDGYARIVQSFQATYTVMYLLSGRLLDAFGTRLGMTCFILWWSAANVLTAMASGFYSLAFFRALLGIGEPGGYTASAKAIAEWFPAKERGAAVGLYTMGGTLGAAAAGPLVAFVTIRWGWRMAFVVTGAAGFLLAACWALIYRRPAEHPRLGESERAYLIKEGVFERPATGQKLSWLELARLKPMWVVLGARMLTDPLWYFYLFWFPKYLQDDRGFTLADVGRTVWVVFVAADLGSLLGGWLSGRLMRNGVEAINARLKVMTGSAVLLTLSFALPLSAGRVWPLALASLFAFAHMAWLTCATTFSADIFPPSVIGSAHGAIGAGSSFGGVLSTAVVGWLVTDFSYRPVFLVMSFLHPLALILLLALLPRLARDYRRSLG
jgi:MFS transporter, ACS family, hexuronate transporter